MKGSNLLTLVRFCIIFAPNVYHGQTKYNLTQPNDAWLKEQIDSQEYTNKSEVVNDLIRQARKQQAQIDWIRAKIEVAENSGFTGKSKDQILALAKKSIHGKI